MDEAPRHLYHFCSSLPKAPFVDNKPEFVLGVDENGGKTAKVILPAAIDPSLRETSSLESWQTHTMVKKDCAFEAYRKLYDAGLVNDHLLPYEAIPEEVAEIEERESFADVSSRFDVWKEVAKEWQNASETSVLRISTRSSHETLTRLVMLLPVQLGSQLDIHLFWNSVTHFQTTVMPTVETVAIDSEVLSYLINTSHNMLYSLFGFSMKQDMPSSLQQPYLIIPEDQFYSAHPDELQRLSAAAKLCGYPLLQDLADVEFQDENALRMGLVRRIDRSLHVRPYAFHSFSEKVVERDTPDEAVEIGQQDDYYIPCVKLQQLPKRLDYLHDLKLKDAHTALEYVAVKDCKFDPFPLAYARAMLFFIDSSKNLSVCISWLRRLGFMTPSRTNP